MRLLCFVTSCTLCSSHAVTQDMPVAEMAHAAEFFGSDGVILTGSSTGCPANTQDLHSVQDTCPELPAIIGSGITEKNFASFASANAFVVGSYFKEGGHWNAPLCERRVKDLVEAVRNYRQGG